MTTRYVDRLGRPLPLGSAVAASLRSPTRPVDRHLVVPDMTALRSAAAEMGLPPGRQAQPVGSASIPRRPNAGAISNNRGSQKIITPGGGTAGSITATVVDTARGEGDPEIFVATLGLTTDPDPAVLYDEPFFATANLYWGIGGAAFSASLDWDQGVTFSLPAEYIRIDAVYTWRASYGGTRQNLRFSAGFGWGTRGDRCLNTLTTTNFTIEAGATSTVRRAPAFARTVTLATDELTPNLAINWYVDSTAGSNAPLLATHVYNVAANSGQQNAAAFPKPNGANWYTIDNYGPSATVVSPVWGICL